MQINKEENKEDLLNEYNSSRQKSHRNKIEMISSNKSSLNKDKASETDK